MLRRAVLVLSLASAVSAPLAVLQTRPAHAAVVISLTLAELVEKSTHVVVAIPKSSSARWENGHIVTYWTVAIDSATAGPARAGDSLTIATLGGVVDKIGQRVEGEAALTIGAPMLLFVRPLPAPPKDIPNALSVVGMAQGAMPVIVGTDKIPRVGPSALGLKLVPGGKEPPASVSQPGRAVRDVESDVRTKWSALGRK
jgi:hypothetical protein